MPKFELYEFVVIDQVAIHVTGEADPSVEPESVDLRAVEVLEDKFPMGYSAEIVYGEEDEYGEVNPVGFGYRVCDLTGVRGDCWLLQIRAWV